MRIARAQISNFRGLEDVEIEFDSVTTFVGPNGAGKSSILHALDWFFNGAAKSSRLTAEDLYMGELDREITVSVEFENLTESDRERLGKYAVPGVDRVTIWKKWIDGEEKIFGRGRTFTPFDLVRSGGSAAERKAQWQALRAERPVLELPAWTTDGAAAATMSEWEAAHGDELTDADVEAANHFFGFVGQAVMSGIFDFIFVSADLRAAEEAADSRSAVIGRILEQAVDRSGADSEISALVEAFGRTQAEVHDRFFADQLRELSEQLTAAVGEFATGREIAVTSRAEPVKPQRVQFGISVLDSTLETRVERQGHGFQRALLVSALRLLAEHGRTAEGEGTICLAIVARQLDGTTF